MNSDRALPALEHGTATSRLQLAEDVVERGCRQLDIIAGAKERLLDAAGLAAELPPSHTRAPRSRADHHDPTFSANYGRIHAAGNIKADMVISVVQNN
jgi:hypothetical protein